MSQIEQPAKRRGGNKALFGFIIIIVGLLLLLNRVGVLPYLHFRGTWPLILIAVGVFVGVRNGFSVGPFILMGIGLVNLIPEFSFHIGDRLVYSRSLIVPAILILVGVFLIIENRKKKAWTNDFGGDINYDKILMADVIFAGKKELVTSKDFKGGRVTATFGGCEINLLQADTTEQQMVMDVRAVFGGVEIIVPSHWEIKNEIEPIFGGVDDKRSIRVPDQTESRKVLILRGSCFCGGVEIKSF
jgi:predicted membrane protein